jgi:di/tricarboxylate transporter
MSSAFGIVGVCGFSSSTVWLVFGAFMFALGYEKTGLGHRIALVMVKVMGRNTLSLGYVTTLTDAILAPVTPSNTARSAGTIYPVVAICRRSMAPCRTSLRPARSAVTSCG